MNQLDAMRVFLRVAELKSFTAAAERLGLPKSSVSTAVKELEAGLGTRLLHRTTRKVRLTQDGQAYYERSKDVLADIDELQTLFQTGAEDLRGRLRVDMPTAVARDVVIPALPGFIAQHPGLELELSSTDRRVDLVREGFDCVLRVGSLSDSSFIVRPLGGYRIISCASADYVKKRGVPHGLNDLNHHQMVHYVPTLGARSEGFEYTDCENPDVPRHLTMPGGLTVNNSDAYLAACLAGIGIIQVPRAGVEAHLRSGRLVEFLPQHRPPAMPVNFIYPHRRQLPKRVQVFMAWVGDLMRARLS